MIRDKTIKELFLLEYKSCYDTVRLADESNTSLHSFQMKWTEFNTSTFCVYHISVSNRLHRNTCVEDVGQWNQNVSSRSAILN